MFDIKQYNLNWKAHLKAISSKFSRVIGLLRKLKYIFPKYILCSIYNTLILPHLNYSLLAWGHKYSKIPSLFSISAFPSDLSPFSTSPPFFSFHLLFPSLFLLFHHQYGMPSGTCLTAVSECFATFGTCAFSSKTRSILGDLSHYRCGS